MSYNYDNTFDGLCYKLSYWDYQQWIEYTDYEIDQLKKVFKLGQQKTELYHIFLSEIFQRLLRQDNVEKIYDTKETFEQRTSDWEKAVDQWKSEKIESGLSNDDYIRIFGNKPEKPKFLKPRNEIEWASKLHTELDDSKEWIELMGKISSETNHVKRWILSGVGALKFGEICAAKLPDPPKQLVDPEELRKKIRELKGQLDDANEKDSQLIQSEIEKLVNQGKGEIFQYQKYAKQFTPKAVENMIKDSAIAAQEAVDEMAAVLEMMSWGWGDESGNPGESGSVDEKLSSAKRLMKSKNFKKIILQAGRLKLLAEAKRKSKTPVQSTITGVKIGDNLYNLLPIEYGRFAHHKSRKLFIKDYSEKSLLEFEKQSNDKNKKGPVVMLIDNSGSMSGEKEIWSKAVAISYLFLCGKDKRDFYAIHFDTQSKAAYQFPKGKFDEKQLVGFINFFSGGGTSWEEPINDAVVIVENSQLYKNADIVLITDDQCGVSDRWKAWLQRKKDSLRFTLYGVLIGSSNKYPLQQFCDKVVAIPSLYSDEAILEIF